MTSEEYIKKNSAQPYTIIMAGGIDEPCMLNTFVKKAVEMARQEEKEKLIDKLCTEILPAYLHGGDIDCIAAELDEK